MKWVTLNYLNNVAVKWYTNFAILASRLYTVTSLTIAYLIVNNLQ